MGWTGICGKFENAEEFIKSQFDCLFGENTVIDYHVTNNKNPNFRKAVCYVAFRNKYDQVMACVISINHYKKYSEYTYKAETEDMDPIVAKCPKRILNILDSPYNESASKWRNRCKEKN